MIINPAINIVVLTINCTTKAAPVRLCLTRQPRLKGKSLLVRFADDFILGCEVEADAGRVMGVLQKRFAKYGLTIHPDKSKLAHFRRPSGCTEKSHTGTFDFLGFTHYWGRARTGNWVVKRQTMRKRQARAMRSIYV